MIYSLDTNVIIFLMSGILGSVRRRFDQAVADSAELYISSVVLFELLYGVHKSQRPDANRVALETILSSGIAILPFTEADAEAAGRLRTSLEKAKQPIGHYDTLIAGQALAHGLTLITANTREFSRVQNLRWEDWTQS